MGLNAYRQAGLALEPQHPVYSGTATVCVAQAIQSAILLAGLAVWRPAALRGCGAIWRASLGAGFFGGGRLGLLVLGAGHGSGRTTVRAIRSRPPIAAAADPAALQGRLSPRQLAGGVMAALGVVATALSLTAAHPTWPGAATIRRPWVRRTLVAAAQGICMTDALAIRGLSKTFGGKVAVDDLTLNVRAGELYALLGPNGAGKTTTLRMVAGLLKPNSGDIQVFGHDVATDPAGAKQIIAWAPDEPMLYDRLSPRWNIWSL